MGKETALGRDVCWFHQSQMRVRRIAGLVVGRVSSQFADAVRGCAMHWRLKSNQLRELSQYAFEKHNDVASSSLSWG